MRSQHRQAMRRALLDAAAELLLAEGAEAVTMKRISGELGWSVGAIYRYVTSKDDLITSTIDDHLGRLHRSLEAGRAVGRAGANEGGRPAELRTIATVQAAAWSWVDAAHSMPRELEIARRRLLLGSPGPTSGDGSVLIEPLAGVLDEAREHGVMSAGDASWRATVIVATLTGVSIRSPNGDEPGGRQLAARLLDCLLQDWGAGARWLSEGARILGLGEAPPGTFAPIVT